MSIREWLNWLFVAPTPTGHVERIEAVAARIEHASKRIEKSADTFDEFGKMVVGMRGKKKGRRPATKNPATKKKGPGPKC